MKIMSTAAVAILAMTVGTGTVFAQDQDGLVNLSVDGNTVQVPVNVAANVCDLDVNVLAEQFVGTDETACEIDQETAAENDIGDFESGNGQNGGNNGNQNGLVNVSVDGNTVQVPVGIAANVCDVQANVLARQFVGSDETACEIDQETAAENNIGNFGNGNGQNGNGQSGGNGPSGNNGNQEGLVNVSVDGNTVQVPVGVAANVCDVDANVLAQQFVGSDETACEIDQETAAENNIGAN